MARANWLIDAVINLPFAISPGRHRPLALPPLRRPAAGSARASPKPGSRSSSRSPAWSSPASSSRSRSWSARRCRCCRRSAPNRSRPPRPSAPTRWQTFWRITLPSIRWGVAYGVVLTTARVLGEFGAVAIVSGNDQRARPRRCRSSSRRSTRTSTSPAPTAPRSLLAVLALVMLVGDEPAETKGGRLMGITVEGASKRFGDFQALDDVSIDVPDGSLTALLGPERQRQVHPAAGDRRARGRSTAAGAHRRRGRLDRKPAQKRGVGFVFQHYAAFKHMTVCDNVAFGLKIRKWKKARDPRAGRRAAEAGAARRARRPLPVAALRRPAPADGAGPGARGPAAGAAARRAVRRARREGPQGAAHLAAPPPRRDARDDDLRHPRPGGGDGRRRPARRDERGPGRAVRHAPTTSTTSPPTSS